MKLSMMIATGSMLAGCYDPSSGAHSAFRGLGDDPTPAATAPAGTTTRPTSPTYRGPTTTTSTPGAGQVQPGDNLAGSLGDIHGFTSDSVEMLVQNNGASVRLDAVNDAAHWWVMTLFTFSRPLSDPAWTPGLVRTFEPGHASPDGLTVSSIGCSGPSRGHYTFDSGPSRITMHIQEGSTPNSRLVSFAEYWDNGPHVVTGTFEYDPR